MILFYFKKSCSGTRSLGRLEFKFGMKILISSIIKPLLEERGIKSIAFVFLQEFGAPKIAFYKMRHSNIIFVDYVLLLLSTVTILVKEIILV